MERDCQHGLYKAGMGSSRVLSDFAEKYGSKNRVLAGFGIGGKSGKEKHISMIIDKQKAQAPASVKAVEQSCVTCGGAHSYKNCPATDGNVYQDNIQEYVSQAAAANFNQGNSNSRPPMVSNQI
ncbi:hypothetical protein Tco_0534219 [Tanacetum coccineum]